MTIVYRLGRRLYLNITNSCSCDCIFCLRSHTDSVGDAPTLWLEHEPAFDEIITALDARLHSDNQPVDEIVFCGFGEPMERADIVIAVGEYIKQNHLSLYGKPAPPVRLNTNGLVFLMHPGFDVRRLSVIDTVSISLNADDSAEYQRLNRPQYGEASFGSMLDFARATVGYTSVMFSVLDGMLSPERLANCRRIARKIGVPLRIRGMD